MNQFINKFNLLHVEVYQNEISRRLLYYSVSFVVIVVFTVIENFSANWSQRWKKIENSSGMHFFMFEIFDQRRWKLRQESHALASK